MQNFAEQVIACHTVALLNIIRLHGLEIHSSLANSENHVTYTENRDFEQSQWQAIHTVLACRNSRGRICVKVATAVVASPGRFD